ncbi:unnamed protein product [Laminaria digitata]
MATAGAGVLDIASVGPLEPVCQAFKALIEAAQGAAESQEMLQRLVSRCAFVTTVLIQHGRVVGPLAQVQKPIGDFVATTNELAAFAAKWAKGGKCRALFCHRIDLATLTNYDESLCRISNDIALVDGLEHRQEALAMARDLLPPPLPDMAAVPAGAPPEPRNYVKRLCLQEAVDRLIHPDKPLAPYTVVGMGGGGKTVLVSAVVRNSSVVDTLLSLKLKLLVTTRDRSIGGVPESCLELGDMAENEARELLLKTSEARGQPGNYGARDEAGGLASKCLLQDMGGGRYRVHDLLLEFVTIKIKAEAEMVKVATTLQAQYLGRLGVVEGYNVPEHGTGDQGLFVLDALWRSVEKLSGDSELEVASYRASLGELESCEATVDVSNSYSFVGGLFHIQGKYAEAEPLYERSHAILEKVLGPEHPGVAVSLNNRAELLREQGKYAEADPLYLRAIEIGEKTLGPDHPDLAVRLNNRAELLRAQGNYAEAVSLNEQATKILMKALDPEHPTVATALNNRGWLLKLQGKYEQADPLFLQAIKIWEAALGPDHPQVATGLNNRAGLLKSQDKFSEAEPLFKRTQEIFEKSFGRDHPNVATILNNQAELLRAQGKYVEAEPLFERSQAIREKTLGPDHPDVARTLSNRAGMLIQQGKHREAVPLLERTLGICKEKLGESNERTVDARDSLVLLKMMFP